MPNSPSSPPVYDNEQFIAAFSDSFISLAKSFDVNAMFDPTDITPRWDMYVYVPGGTEMLFNRTEEGKPVVKPIGTDPAVLQRCACVSFFFPYHRNEWWELLGFGRL